VATVIVQRVAVREIWKMKKKASPRKRPQRTCIGCRQVKDKSILIRLVLTAEGRIEIDPSGKKAGRGTYLCRNQNCWREGLNTKNLEKVLKSKVNKANMAELIEKNQYYLEQE